MASAAMPRRLLYVVTEDWFFRSHFLPMADAAQAAGFAIHVACRCGPARADLEARGWRVAEMTGRRSSMTPGAILAEMAALRRIIREMKPDLVHFIALRPLLAGFALALAGGTTPSIYALTGRGLLGVEGGLRARALRTFLRGAAPRLARNGRSGFLFENRDDPGFLGLDPAAAGVTILGGAGVDPDAWPALPFPESATLKAAFVGRMLAFKGVADAVEAVTQARAAGAAVELSLYGAPDPENPAAIPAESLAEWGRRPGIAWSGRAADVRAVWAAHHLCVQPSHEVEGLPRALLEAAASGRALLATDTPGCRDFVRDGVEGLLVPPRRPDLMAAALVALAADRPRVAAMGAAARARIRDGFTEKAVAAAVLSAYGRLLAAA
jgi:glycosyltransferase involved in cell wall biosynthesis